MWRNTIVSTCRRHSMRRNGSLPIDGFPTFIGDWTRWGSPGTGCRDKAGCSKSSESTINVHPTRAGRRHCTRCSLRSRRSESWISARSWMIYLCIPRKSLPSSEKSMQFVWTAPRIDIERAATSFVVLRTSRVRTAHRRLLRISGRRIHQPSGDSER